MSGNQGGLAQGALRPLFLNYAVPGVVAMVFVALQSVADGVIVGQLLGADALAAVNIVIPAYTLVTTVALVLGVGTQAQMGIHAGRGDWARVRGALRSGLSGVAVFAAAGTLVLNVWADGVVAFLGADEELSGLSKGYLYGVMPWIAGVAGSMFFDYILKALGHPRQAMFILVGTIVGNVVLSVVFVGEGMGTFGAGLGTGLSFTAGSLVSGWMVWRVLRGGGALAEAKGRFSWRTLGRICYNGSSEGMAELAMGITIFLFNVTLMRYAGKEGVAAFTLINYILFLGVSVILGVSNGVIPLLSYNYGAGLQGRVKGILRLAALANVGCGLVVMAVLWGFGREIVELFVGSGEGKVVEMTVRGVLLVMPVFLFNGLNILAASFFTAVDRAGLSLLVALSRGLVLNVAGMAVLPQWLGVDGVWLVMPVADALTAVWVAVAARKFLLHL